MITENNPVIKKDDEWNEDNEWNKDWDNYNVKQQLAEEQPVCEYKNIRR